MVKKGKKREDFKWHIWWAIFANLLASSVSAGAFFLVIKHIWRPTPEETTAKLLASVVALVSWCITYVVVVIFVRHGKPFKKNLKYIGYYFPLTTLFVWAFDQRCLRHKVEDRFRRLEKIVDDYPDVRTIAGIVDPEKQRETLSTVIETIDSMEDNILSQILQKIRDYADEILRSVGNNGNRDLFMQVMEKVSFSDPEDRPETYKRLLWLLSDVFSMSPKKCFTKQVQIDMIGPLKNFIWRVDRSNLNRAEMMIEQIMSNKEEEHDIARQILDMLLYFNWKEKQEICQIIFDKSKKRAFRFPQGFGFDFLRVLNELGHKVFWLDVQSLRDLLEEAIEYGETGLINLKRTAYDELCSKVFAPIEDEEYAGIQNRRVFRRLKEEGGCAEVECTFSDGSGCKCKAESLSFRGLYSKTCDQEEGNKFEAKVIPIVEIGQSKSNPVFTLKASVAKLHAEEARKQSKGRGIFFEQAEENVVKELYEYISAI